MPLVQGTVFLDGDAGLPDRLEDDREGFLRAPQGRRERAIKTEGPDAFGSATRLRASGVDERHVHPTGKAVVKIPLRLAVTNEHEDSHGGSIVAQSHSVSKILVRCP